MSKIKAARKKQAKREKKVAAKKAPKQKPQDKDIKVKAAKQNAEVGSGPVVTNKSQKINKRPRRRSGKVL